jgi:hypothetical protein
MFTGSLSPRSSTPPASCSAWSPTGTCCSTITPTIKDTPSLDHCVPGCGNIARTDQQAAQLRERALALETQAAHVPQPIGDRLPATAARLRDQVGKHDRTRITTGKNAG